MRWRITPPAIPRLWETREVRRFAWLPVVAIGSTGIPYRVWLEHFVEQQQYMGLDANGWNWIARWLA